MSKANIESKVKPADVKIKPSKTETIHQETHGDKSPAIKSDGDVNMTINLKK